MKQLFHFTSLDHWNLDILPSGIILPTESNLHRDIDHYGPDVVWLTDNPASNQRWMRLPKNLLEWNEMGETGRNQ